MGTTQIDQYKRLFLIDTHIAMALSLPACFAEVSALPAAAYAAFACCALPGTGYGRIVTALLYACSCLVALFLNGVFYAGGTELLFSLLSGLLPAAVVCAIPDKAFRKLRATLLFYRERTLPRIAINRNRRAVGEQLYEVSALFREIECAFRVQECPDDADAHLRARLNEELETYGAEHMLEKLRALDPAAAERLHPNNTRRVIRAIEIALSGEKNMTGSADEKPVPDVIAVKFEPADRAELYRRIDLRTDKMMDGGLAEEIASLAPDFTEQSMQAIGYKEFAPYRDRIRNGKFRLTQAETEFIRAQIKQHTRNYAKRQLTWFRRYSFAKSFNIGDFEGAANYVKSRLNERGERKGELL